MFEITLTATEAEIILRAMAVAEATGTFPDPAMDGDSVRFAVLRNSLRAAVDKHQATLWGKVKVRR